MKTEFSLAQLADPDIQEADAVAAHHFCDAVEAALKLLSAHPEIARKARFPKAPEARIWPVR